MLNVSIKRSWGMHGAQHHLSARQGDANVTADFVSEFDTDPSGRDIIDRLIPEDNVNDEVFDDLSCKCGRNELFATLSITVNDDDDMAAFDFSQTIICLTRAADQKIQVWLGFVQRAGQGSSGCTMPENQKKELLAKLMREALGELKLIKSTTDELLAETLQEIASMIYGSAKYVLLDIGPAFAKVAQ